MTLNAPAPGYVVKLRSRFDFKTTIERITELLAARGITIFADIDQAFAAANAGGYRVVTGDEAELDHC